MLLVPAVGMQCDSHVGQVPHAVVFPLTTAEVSSLVKVAARHRIPVIPYGSGTSLEGHTLASDFGKVTHHTLAAVGSVWSSVLL